MNTVDLEAVREAIAEAEARFQRQVVQPSAEVFAEMSKTHAALARSMSAGLAEAGRQIATQMQVIASCLPVMDETTRQVVARYVEQMERTTR